MTDGAVNQSPGMNEREGVEPLCCPFCGKPPVLLATTEDDNFVRCYAVRCDNCGIGVSEEYKDQTIELWNTRAPAPSAWQPEGQPAGWVVKFNDERCFYWEQAVAEWKAGEFDDQHKTKATIEPVFFCPSSDRGGVG